MNTEAARPQQPDSPQTDAACDRWFETYRDGPVQTRWTSVPLQAGDVAPSPKLTDARTEQTVTLDRYWDDGPALVIFWRHFGCGCGRERAALLIEEMDLYRPLKAKVVMICQGEPERAQTYLQANFIPDDVAVLVDANEEAYRAFDITDCGPIEVLFDATDEYLKRDLDAGQSLAKERKASGMPLVDNAWLLPAEFVIAENGLIAYTYRHQFCENWIDPRVHVAAIRTSRGDFETN